jgi:2-polyprenyl-6-methoxyphenol hydroxylase-like FAD-dependent oxidoreductase
MTLSFHATIHIPYTMPLQIAIIGAGIAGLSAAIGLHRAGHDAVVGLLCSLTMRNYQPLRYTRDLASRTKSALRSLSHPTALSSSADGDSTSTKRVLSTIVK